MVKFQNTNIRNILNEALNYGGIIVDVRDREDFAVSHVPMAINLPLEDIQQGNISLYSNRWYNRQYCPFYSRLEE